MSSHVINLTIVDGASTFNSSQTVTDVGGRSVTSVLAPGATNTEVDIVLTNADVKSLLIQSIGGDLTIKTNSTSAPDNTVVMVAGQLTPWSSAAVPVVGTNPFAAANVTKLFLSSTAGTTFNLRAVVNAANG